MKCLICFGHLFIFLFVLLYFVVCWLNFNSNINSSNIFLKMYLLQWNGHAIAFLAKPWLQNLKWSLGRSWQWSQLWSHTHPYDESKIKTMSAENNRAACPIYNCGSNPSLSKRWRWKWRRIGTKYYSLMQEIYCTTNSVTIRNVDKTERRHGTKIRF